jgi:exosortase/archaeosortase family protein
MGIRACAGMKADRIIAGIRGSATNRQARIVAGGIPTRLRNRMKLAGGKIRILVAMAPALLLAIWLAAHAPALVREQNGLIRFVLTVGFAVLVLIRRKPNAAPWPVPRALPPLAAIGGTILAIAGLVFSVRQFEWLGLLLLAVAGALWGLSDRAARDVALAGVVLYWAHPLPGRLFGALQLAMQQASVLLAERFLHLVNVRVWADGLVLRTGATVFEVPSWCSGMRTATTTLVLAIGLAAWRGLRWVEWLPLLAAALIQALLLNVLRIAAMALLTPAGAGASGAKFFHDTTGALAVVAVALLAIELRFIQYLRDRRERHRQELNPLAMRVLSQQPHRIHRLLRWRWAVAGALAAAALIGTLAWRGRPHHRAAMIRDVAEALREAGQLDEAQRAMALIARYFPEDEEWRTATIRFLLIRGRYAEALAALDRVADADEAAGLQHRILRAYALMGLDRSAEAAALLDAVPRAIRDTDPRANMVLAEVAVRGNDADAAARAVAIAARWPPNRPRIRALYPFLRAAGRWAAIGASDAPDPYRRPEQAFVAVEAAMNLNDAPRVAELVLQMLRDWPADPRILEPLFFLAMRRESEWEGRFETHLGRLLPALAKPDELFALIGKCFQLDRPDLAWRVHDRLRAVDADHPYLFLAAARFGGEWFSFRRRHIGLQAASATDRVDLRPYFILGRVLPGWSAPCARIPFGEAFAATNTVARRQHLLQDAIRRFRQRDGAGQLTRPMQYALAGALEIAGDVPAARARLERIAGEAPAERNRVRFTLSEIYERQADWPNVYETLRGYAEETAPALAPLLRLCQAQIALRLRLAAQVTVRRALALYPESTQAASFAAQLLLLGGEPEESLFLLAQPRPRRQFELDVLEAQSLALTERHTALRAFVATALLPQLSAPAVVSQRLFLPPAPLSLLWHRLHVPTAKAFDEHARWIEAESPTVSSPFLRDLFGLWLACHRAGSVGAAADPAPWEACGRDRVEKALALSQLCLLLCAREDYARAGEVAAAAVRHAPEIPILWRYRIGLSGGDAAVLRQARQACPADPEIWLADLCGRVRPALDRLTADAAYPFAAAAQAAFPAATNATAHAVAALLHAAPPASAGPLPGPATNVWNEAAARAGIEADVRRDIASGQFSPGAMARAGDLLYRIGWRDLAALAARDAMPRARGLLPAYVLAIRCAMASKDIAWAREATQLAIRSSPTPPPVLYAKLVELKSADGRIETDSEIVESLRKLRAAYPDDPRWAQTLGYVRFTRGGWEIVDALYQMTVAIQGGATNPTPYAIAAEAARLMGDLPRAVEWLRKAVARHPNDANLLNNLVYTLAFDPGTVAEAVSRLPALMERDPRNLRILDTAAAVYLRAGDVNKAEDLTERLAVQTTPDSALGFRARTYRAAVALKRNRPQEAANILRSALEQSVRVSDEDVAVANRLLAECERLGVRVRDEAAPPGPTVPAPP